MKKLKKKISKKLAAFAGKSDFLVRTVFQSLDSRAWGDAPLRGSLFLKEMARHNSKSKPVYKQKKFALANGQSFKLDLCLNEYTSLGYFLQTEIDPLSKLLAKYSKGTFVDIGANIGFYSVQAACYFKDVVSFEPDPANFKELQKNIALSQKSNISPQQIGLSDTEGKTKLWQVAENHGGYSMVGSGEGQGNFVEVDVFRFDDVIKKLNSEVEFIKIDVEGYETKVLQGMTKFFANQSPDLFIEISSAAQFDEIIALLPSHYVPLCPVKLKPVVKSQAWKYNDVFFTTKADLFNF